MMRSLVALLLIATNVHGTYVLEKSDNNETAKSSSLKCYRSSYLNEKPFRLSSTNATVMTCNASENNNRCFKASVKYRLGGKSKYGVERGCASSEHLIPWMLTVVGGNNSYDTTDVKCLLCSADKCNSLSGAAPVAVVASRWRVFPLCPAFAVGLLRYATGTTSKRAGGAR